MICIVLFLNSLQVMGFLFRNRNRNDGNKCSYVSRISMDRYFFSSIFLRRPKSFCRTAIGWKKYFHTILLMASYPPFWSLLAPTDETEAILYTFCVHHSRYDLQCYFCCIESFWWLQDPYRRSLTGGTLPLTFSVFNFSESLLGWPTTQRWSIFEHST